MKERTLETPSLNDIEKLAEGRELTLNIDEKELEASDFDSKKNPNAPGGSAVPLTDDDVE